jgi:chorismate synthase
MPTILTSKSTLSKRVVVAVGAVPVKRLVRQFLAIPFNANYPLCYLGRVAAGAIAEKYLKEAHGIEVVAFVSSVGKIHLPSSSNAHLSSAKNGDEDNDETDDSLSPEFRTLLATVTREEVDKFTTRCPHVETSERMTKVCQSILITQYLTGVTVT